MMATVNFRVDEALKEKSYSILKEQGIAPTDFFTSILEYVATTGKLPVKKALLSEEDEYCWKRSCKRCFPRFASAKTPNSRVRY